MLRWLIRRRMAAFERDFDYDMSYARDLYDASPRAFFRFSKILGMSSYRESASKEAWYAAKLSATLAEDCGPCTQLVVKMAEREGVNASVLRAVLTGDEAAMPADALLGFHFARAVLRRDIAGSDRLRREVLARWGGKGLVSLALTIASSRMYPNLKYALGHGHACTKVSLEGNEVAVQH